MEHNEMISQLALIIANYRREELPLDFDATHVEKWLCQFTDECQDVILSETVYILSHWYFNKQYIEEKFLDVIVDFLCKKYKYGFAQDLCYETVFVDVQRVGQSQKQLIQMLYSRLDEQYQLKLNLQITEGKRHFVYIDDGLYTGSRARKDLVELLYEIPPDSTLDVFYLVASSNGLAYTADKIAPTANSRNIIVSLYRLKNIENIRRVNPQYIGDSYKKSYGRSQLCLWPDKDSQKIQRISDYEKYLQSISSKHITHLYRESPWNNDCGIFSSVHNRNVVEREFLLKGIEILSSISSPKGKYPLGYNLWPSFGFGSFCASDLNISNTCPLVLWWGNIEKQGNTLDNWYPLFPRRANDINDDISIMEDDPIENKDYSSIQYNMCPDCGKGFGFETDGGNGFCVDCAWKH